jgi:riboflavin synthase alpha subunit
VITAHINYTKTLDRIKAGREQMQCKSKLTSQMKDLSVTTGRISVDGVGQTNLFSTEQ